MNTNAAKLKKPKVHRKMRAAFVPLSKKIKTKKQNNGTIRSKQMSLRERAMRVGLTVVIPTNLRTKFSGGVQNESGSTVT